MVSVLGREKEEQKNPPEMKLPRRVWRVWVSMCDNQLQHGLYRLGAGCVAYPACPPPARMCRVFVMGSTGFKVCIQDISMDLWVLFWDTFCGGSVTFVCVCSVERIMGPEARLGIMFFECLAPRDPASFQYYPQGVHPKPKSFVLDLAASDAYPKVWPIHPSAVWDFS